MHKMMKRYLSLVLSLCMLVMAMPSVSLAEDVDAFIETPAPTASEPTPAAEETMPAATEPTPAAAETTPAASETTPAAEETTPAASEPTPAASETTPAAEETTPASEETTPAAEETTPVAEETTPAVVETTPATEAMSAPAPMIVALEGAPSTMEAMYGLYEDELDLPELLTAVYSDETRSELAVSWVCISDGMGGTVYDGECENYEQVRFTFEARLPEGALCAEGLTLPQVQVQLVLPDLDISTYDVGESGTSATPDLGKPAISKSKGVLSYTYSAPEGVTVTGRQWLKGDEKIADATNETYSLTMADMNTGSSFKVQLTVKDSNGAESVLTSDPFTISNSDWTYDADTKTLTIVADNDHCSGAFPIDWKSVTNVAIAENNNVSGMTISVNGNVTIRAGARVSKLNITAGDVTVGAGAEVSSSTISCKTLNVNSGGTIHGSTIRGSVTNGGVIYNCTFGAGASIAGNTGEIHIPVTIDGTGYVSEPGDNVKFLYGASPLAALKARYETVYGLGSSANCVWLASGGEVTDQTTLGLNGDSFTYFGKLSCSIDSPVGYTLNSVLYADIDLDAKIEGVTTSYRWLDDDGSELVGSEANKPFTITKIPSEPTCVTLEVVVQIPNHGSVSRRVKSNSTIVATSFVVEFDYANDALIITPCEGKQIASISAHVVNATQSVKAERYGDDGKWIVPLNGIGEGEVEVYLRSVRDPNGNWLFGPAYPYSMRANAPARVHISPDDSSKLTLSWNSDESLEFGIRDSATGDIKSIGTKNSGETITLSDVQNATLSVRTPGNSATRTLPSKWIDVGAFESNQWLYLSITSQHNLSSSDTLFCGEVLEINTTADATLTWKINGEDADASLTDGKYTIPEGVTSLSITAKDNNGSVTSELIVKSPIVTRQDYKNEALIVRLNDDFDKESLSLKIKGNPESKDFVNLQRGVEYGMKVYPEGNGRHLLSIAMEYEGNTYHSQMYLDQRFPGPKDGLEISVKGGGVDFDTQTGQWTATVESEKDNNNIVWYTAVQVRGNNNTTIDYVPGDNYTWMLPPGVHLDGNVTYTVYAKQSNIQFGNWFTYESEWFDTGVFFTVAPTWLSNDQPLVGDTVTAGRGLGFNFSNGMRWQWYLVDESGNAEKISNEISNEEDPPPCMALPEYAGKQLRLALEYNGRILHYLDTEAIPEPQLIVTRANGEELKKDAGGRYIAYPGDVLKVEAKNVSENAMSVYASWSWLGNQGIVLGTGDTLKITGDNVSGYSNLCVRLALGNENNPITISQPMVFHVTGAPEVSIDYENETLFAVKPDGGLLEGYQLYGMTEAEFFGKGENNVYTVPIAGINADWPNDSNHNVCVCWADETNPSGKPKSTQATVTIPARPEVEEPATVCKAFAITVTGASTKEYNISLTAAGASSQDESVGVRFEDAESGIVRFAGLDQNTTYMLWVQKKATDSSFRSAWKSFDVSTCAAIGLTASLAPATFDPSGFALYEKDVKALLSLRAVGLPVKFTDSDITLTRIDGKSFPIVNAGTYELKLTLNGELADSCRLNSDTLTLEVKPYAVAEYSFSNRKTYTGKEMDPYAFELKVGDLVLTKDDYTIAVDDGAKLLDAGTYTAQIVFKGNYKNGDSLDGSVSPVIEPFTLRATATAQNREYDGTTSVVCTASWDNCAPFGGDDVTARVDSASMADAHAGTDKPVTVHVSLSGAKAGNYRLEADVLNAAVDIAPRKVTVNPETPADFSFNGSTDVPLTGQGWTLDGAVPGDDVRVDATNARASVSEPNAGADKPVSFTGITLAGESAADYVIGSVTAHTVTIEKAAAPAINWPTADEITYGQCLGDSVLSHTKDDHGSFAWEKPDYQPDASDDVAYNMIYAPDDTNNYDYSRVKLMKSVAIVVNRAKAVIDISGVQTQYVYTGERQSVNSGATLNHSECELAYENNSFTTVAQGDCLQVKITASQTANYLAAEATATIRVARAEAPQIIFPAAAKLTYGQKLSESALTGGEDAPGSFAWEDGSVVPGAGFNRLNVVFTPDDPDNYAWTQEMLVQKIEVIVDQRPASLTIENASKTYGDADPKVKVALSGVLKGDALNYTVSRRSGEDVDQYAYSVKLGSNPNYRIDLLPGTLTIAPRSIADEAVKVSGPDAQVYTGAEIRPDVAMNFGGVKLTKGTDYELSYTDNINPGSATITITGKGNFSGSRSVNFTIKEKAPAATPDPTATPAPTTTATATSAPSMAPISDEALQEYLNDMVSLVFDEAYNPADYEQIPVLVSGEAEKHTLLICANQEDGEPAQRSLILNAAQLVGLQQAMPEAEIDDLIFENGNVSARMSIAELTGGSVAKLMALVLSGEEITDEILQSDWSTVEEATLSIAAFERFNLEVRIVPVAPEDGTQGFEISVWLHCGALNLNVSGLIDSLCVVLDVSSLVTEENADTFDDLYAIARKDGEEIELLDSTLVLVPTVSGDGSAEKSETPAVTGRYALTARYAGEGMYCVAARQAG